MRILKEKPTLAEKKEAKLGIFEKYLTLWIAICIVVACMHARRLAAH